MTCVAEGPPVVRFEVVVTGYWLCVAEGNGVFEVVRLGVNGVLRVDEACVESVWCAAWSNGVFRLVKLSVG